MENVNSNLHQLLIQRVISSYNFHIFYDNNFERTPQDQKINSQYILNKFINLFTQKKHKFFTIVISLSFPPY